MQPARVLEQLSEFEEPSIRYKILVGTLGESEASKSVRELQAEVKSSRLVKSLLQHRDRQGRISNPKSVYAKWQGAHWILASLADIGYPAGDEELAPLRDQVQEHWLRPDFFREFEAASRSGAYRRRGVPMMQGRYRRCASQQANALWSVVKLGLGNSRTDELVERLLHWQWPDGGWNCDKNPSACNSSFMESILPLRALALYGRRYRHRQASAAANRAAEIFLKRALFRRRSDMSVIAGEFALLHYPLYWHYDYLHGLKVMAESGFIGDPRCDAALDLLQAAELPQGGWPAQGKYYKVSREIKNGNDLVDWGGTSQRAMNPWVTADALFVLKSAGRLG